MNASKFLTLARFFENFGCYLLNKCISNTAECGWISYPSHTFVRGLAHICDLGKSSHFHTEVQVKCKQPFKYPLAACRLHLHYHFSWGED